MRYTSAPTEAGSSPVWSGDDRLPLRDVCATGCRVDNCPDNVPGGRLWGSLGRAFSLPPGPQTISQRAGRLRRTSTSPTSRDGIHARRTACPQRVPNNGPVNGRQDT